jgi:hypothetical protein
MVDTAGIPVEEARARALDLNLGILLKAKSMGIDPAEAQRIALKVLTEGHDGRKPGNTGR